MAIENATSGLSQDRLTRLREFLQQDPDNPNLLADTADEALRTGCPDIARSTIQHALDVLPGDPYFRLRLSSTAISEGNFDEAIDITSRLIDEGMTDEAVRFNHAYALMSSSRFAEAKDWLEGLVAEDSSLAGIVPMLVRCHHYLGDLERAMALAQQQLDAAPEDAQVAGMLSLLFFDRNDFASAGTWSRRALAMNPNDLDALLAAGGVALATEDSHAATDLMHRAISVQPRSGRAWANLGLAHMLALDLQAAREALSNAVRYMSGHIGTWIALGWVQLMQNDIDGAEASFNAALAIDENFGETHGGLAAVAAMRGNWPEAEESAKVARRLDSGSMSHQYVQIVKKLKDGDPTAVDSLLRRALEQRASPAGGTLLDMLARVLRSRNS